MVSELSTLVACADRLRKMLGALPPDVLLGHHVEVHGQLGHIIGWLVAPQARAVQAHAAIVEDLRGMIEGLGVQVALNLYEATSDTFIEWEILQTPDEVLSGHAFDPPGKYAEPVDEDTRTFLSKLVSRTRGL